MIARKTTRLLPLAIAVFLIQAAAMFSQSAQPLQFQSDTLDQNAIAGGRVTLDQIRHRGMDVFGTPFTAAVGYGDGPTNPNEPGYPTGLGARPTLQGNGKYLRVNGLDAQTCMECHSVGSNLTVPFTFAIGGSGGSNSNALFQPTIVDVAETVYKGTKNFNGRFINPPFLFGAGGVELVGKEMTEDLQALKKQAKANPGNQVPLITKGVSFGAIIYQNGKFDTTGVRGIDDDLVVRPFDRKGEFSSVRAFDIEALQFHLGMQPVEVFGLANDADGDGVVNEISKGDLSSLSIFVTNLDRPYQAVLDSVAQQGQAQFLSIGCGGCHIPKLETQTPILKYSLPEVETDPSANVYYQADLTLVAGFDLNANGGIEVPLFSDLKRHDMGEGLKENFGTPIDSQFITARLWGVADSAPYLHDGRAQTLQEAILLHGGEAQFSRDAFAALTDEAQQQLLAYLMTLRTPAHPAADMLQPAKRSSRIPRFE